MNSSPIEFCASLCSFGTKPVWIGDFFKGSKKQERTILLTTSEICVVKFKSNSWQCDRRLPFLELTALKLKELELIIEFDRIKYSMDLHNGPSNEFLGACLSLFKYLYPNKTFAECFFSYDFQFQPPDRELESKNHFLIDRLVALSVKYEFIVPPYVYWYLYQQLRKYGRLDLKFENIPSISTEIYVFLLEALADNDCLVSLSLINVHLKGALLDRLRSILMSVPSLESLSFVNVNNYSCIFNDLINANVIHIKIQNCPLSDRNLIIFFQTFSSKLRTLELSSIGRTLMPFINEIVNLRFPHLEKFCIEDTQINPEGQSKLQVLLSSCTNLKHLSLKNTLSKIDLILPSNLTFLKYLNISFCEIKRNCSSLHDLIINCQNTLLELNIHGSKVCENEAIAIVHALNEACIVWLGENNWSLGSAMSFSRVFQQPLGGVVFCDLNRDFLLELLALLPPPMYQTIGLVRCVKAADLKLRKALLSYLSNAKNVERFIIHDFIEGENLGTAISEFIEVSSGFLFLRDLEILNSHLNVKYLEKFGMIFRRCHHLSRFNLKGLEISSEKLHVLAEVARKYPMLEWIDLSFEHEQLNNEYGELLKTLTLCVPKKVLRKSKSSSVLSRRTSTQSSNSDEDSLSDRSDSSLFPFKMIASLHNLPKRALEKRKSQILKAPTRLTPQFVVETLNSLNNGINLFDSGIIALLKRILWNIYECDVDLEVLETIEDFFKVLNQYKELSSFISVSSKLLTLIHDKLVDIEFERWSNGATSKSALELAKSISIMLKFHNNIDIIREHCNRVRIKKKFQIPTEVVKLNQFEQDEGENNIQLSLLGTFFIKLYRSGDLHKAVHEVYELPGEPEKPVLKLHIDVTHNDEMIGFNEEQKKRAIAPEKLAALDKKDQDKKVRKSIRKSSSSSDLQNRTRPKSHVMTRSSTSSVSSKSSFANAEKRSPLSRSSQIDKQVNSTITKRSTFASSNVNINKKVSLEEKMLEDSMIPNPLYKSAYDPIEFQQKYIKATRKQVEQALKELEVSFYH
eukprot:TRINITY_DN3074_c0_g1_i2.p1 TRINITY_DN3074_c0_g1~~TRINITY_DN3074_c0_g1_i2.p1  ORF type:complete len:1037 (-),score=259.54 TRINITY_DN3074_c0_g1_i2:1188-4268(-)